MQRIFVEYEYLDITGDIHNKWHAFADWNGLGLNKIYIVFFTVF